jgi:hypothetical protein
MTALQTAAASRGRVSRHLQPLAILWLAVSVLRLSQGFVLNVLVPPFVHWLQGGTGSLFLMAGALGIVVGWGLLWKKPPARMQAIVLGAILLVDIPFGTAVGVYTLWVLLPAQSAKEYSA